MQILLANDDGIHAPGMAALANVLPKMGDVQIVAPASEQSGVGHSITYLHPLMVQEELRDGKHFGWAVAGSPADCVKLGVLEFCDSPPDLIVSGINNGANVGINVLYSGTVAAAIEGAFYGITSIAVSYAGKTARSWDNVAKVAYDVIKQLQEITPRPGCLWNVNIPEIEESQPRGVKWTRMGVKRHLDVMEKRTDPRGRAYFWSGLDPLKNHQMEPGSDVNEISKGYVTVTPLHFDLTDGSLLESSQSELSEIDLDLPSDRELAP